MKRENSGKTRNRIQNSTSNWPHQDTEKNQAHKYKNKSNSKSFVSDLLVTIFIVKEQRLQKLEVSNILFLNLYTSPHFCNNQIPFNNVKVKNIDFIKAVR